MRTCLSELELISQSLQGLVTVKTSSHKLTIIDSSFENDVAENNDIKQVNMGRTRTSEYSNILMYIMNIKAYLPIYLPIYLFIFRQKLLWSLIFVLFLGDCSIQLSYHQLPLVLD